MSSLSLLTIHLSSRNSSHLFIHLLFSDDLDAFCQQRVKKEHKDKLFPRCTKDFPAEFSDYTTLREDGKPIYRRRANGAFVNRKNSKGQMVSFSQLFFLTQRSSQVDVSNQWIVPYNPFLLHKYRSHCNVEVVSKVHVVKYIYKYIFKVSFDGSKL